jgi:hypothetical protein
MKMTIHRALKELKLLNDRITKEISTAGFVLANKRSNTNVSGRSVEDVSKNIVSSYNSVKDLIKRRNNIKQAIVLSNASTLVTVNSVSMTVAEAIERKQSIEFDRHFLKTLYSQWSTQAGKMNKENEQLQGAFEKFLMSFAGNKDNLKPEAIKQMQETFNAQNEYVLIDPINVFEKYRQLEKEVNGFEAEVDAVLSESNAVTFIEVE